MWHTFFFNSKPLDHYKNSTLLIHFPINLVISSTFGWPNHLMI